METPTGQPIHVALNAHLLSGSASYRSAGVHQYIYHLLRYLPTECQVTALLGPQSSLPDENGQAVYSRWPTANPALRVAWEQLAQPWALRRVQPDLLHSPAFVTPLLSSLPAVVTVHDLSFVRFPHLFRPANRLYLRTMTRLAVYRARQVIAVSNHAADETARLLGVARDRVQTVYHGIDPRFHPYPQETVDEFRAARHLPPRFLLYLGTLEPRKNLVRLVEAFAALREPGIKLILAGAKGWYYETLFARVEQLELQDKVLFPGYVPPDELPLWYNGATAFVFPSLYEGFGMPVLEAQACGTPVITSDSSALPEAAGDGALLVDPEDVKAITAALHRILTDADLRATLRQRGLAHAARFTWQRTAAETVAVYRQALSRDVK